MVWMNLDSAILAASSGLVKTIHTMTVGNLLNPTQNNGGYQGPTWQGGAIGGFVVPRCGSRALTVGRYGAGLGTLSVYLVGASLPRDYIQGVEWDNPSGANYSIMTECTAYTASVISNGTTFTKYDWSGSNVNHGFTPNVGTVTMYCK